MHYDAIADSMRVNFKMVGYAYIKNQGDPD